MTKTLLWTIGEGGLLGSHLKEALQKSYTDAECFSPSGRFAWNDHAVTIEKIRNEVQAFEKKFWSGSFDQWVVAWAAGAGIIGSSEETLTQETETLRILLITLKAVRLTEIQGTVFLASSAGALSPECTSGPTTEETPPEPISEYGRQKRKQEELVALWAKECPKMSVLIGRISNLYGSGQSLRKGQGLLSHLSKSVLLRQPINIFVSFDTIRDYISAKDAANSIAECMRVMQEKNIPQCITKIIASEMPVTIGELLAVFKRVVKKPLRTVQSVSPLTSLQRHHVYFRSVRLPLVQKQSPTSLLEGIAELHAKNKERLAAGVLER